VTDIDSSYTLVGYSRRQHADGTYLQSDSAALPFRVEVFDLVVAYNSLQVVADMSGTIREAARIPPAVVSASASATPWPTSAASWTRGRRRCS
jgi:ubiquinone/menaquinone biosynthesis C-methylase UbiE